MVPDESTLNDSALFACTCINECKNTQCGGKHIVTFCEAMSCTAVQIAGPWQDRRKSLSGRRCWGLSTKTIGSLRMLM